MKLEQIIISKVRVFKFEPGRNPSIGFTEKEQDPGPFNNARYTYANGEFASWRKDRLLVEKPKPPKRFQQALKIVALGLIE
jgi:hypothetical protein